MPSVRRARWRSPSGRDRTQRSSPMAACSSSAVIRTPARCPWRSSADPGTERFVPAGATHRTGYVLATLLADGRVVIMSDASIEVWDPSKLRFTLSGTVPPANLIGPPDGLSEVHSTATLQVDGSVLVVRHNGIGQPVQASTWDPKTDTFSPAERPHGRHFRDGTVLPDGRILVAGGYDEGGAVEALGSASNLGSTERPVHGHGVPHHAAVGAHGNAPGRRPSACLRRARRAYPGQLRWSTRADPGDRRLDRVARRPLRTGGMFRCRRTDSPISVSRTPWTRPRSGDPATGLWSPTGSMLHPNYSMAAVLLREGRVLVVGGWLLSQGTPAEVFELK